MSTELDELKKLPISDKLRIVEELWDDIRNSDEPLGLPKETKKEIQRRAAELETNPESALTREELWQRVDTPNA